MGDPIQIRPVRGLLRQVMELAREKIADQLLRGSVFFFESDEAAGATRIAASGVLADLQGTKVVFTAAHVLDDFAREFDDGRMRLSVHQRRGFFRVKPEFPRFRTPGHAQGADAGVLVIPNDDAATYFNFGGFEPPGARAIKAATPPIGIECVVAGFPARLGMSTDGNLEGHLMIFGTVVEETDGVHVWLNAEGRMRHAVSGEEVELHPGDLNGMSGCGCWLLEGNLDRPMLGLRLYGVHTGTALPRLRETPMVHHLRLLAGMNDEMRAKVTRLWPEAEI